MNLQDMFGAMSERLRESASVRTVYGEPVSAEGRTIIPVARVAYGFGGGGGQGTRSRTEADGEETDKHGDARRSGEGGGGGGGVIAAPAGVVEISATGTRFIPTPEPRRLAMVFLAGIMVGALLRRPRR